MSYNIVTTTVTASPQTSGASSASVSIIVAPSGFGVGPQQSAIAESIPNAIQPPGGSPLQPSDTTLVQVGFLQPLNYPFVVNSEVTQDQLFTYLPSGLSYVTIIEGENVTMHSLRAYDTTPDYRYITTLAFLFIPTSSIDILKSAIQSPDSPLYNNPDNSIKKIMSYINPAISVDAGATLNSTNSPNPNVPSFSARSSSASPSSTLSASESSLTPEPSPPSLNTGEKIGIGIAVPTFIIALLTIGLLLWRRWKAAHRPSTAGNEENESKTYEMPTEEYQGELTVEYNHELSGEERQELPGDAWKRELRGPECAQELETSGNNPRQSTLRGGLE
ncbi:MAG: hypothetical protein Q9171_006411 [Xanthocarpia ochracea]